jgi:hypothetical protein
MHLMPPATRDLEKLANVDARTFYVTTRGNGYMIDECRFTSFPSNQALTGLPVRILPFPYAHYF